MSEDYPDSSQEFSMGSEIHEELAEEDKTIEIGLGLCSSSYQDGITPREIYRHRIGDNDRYVSIIKYKGETFIHFRQFDKVEDILQLLSLHSL